MSNLIYYSVNTKLAHYINEKYYKDTHYVWVAPYFNPSTNPRSSNPYELYKNLIKELKQDIVDYHSSFIINNKVGLQHGAIEREKEGLITAATREKIFELIHICDHTAFLPVIYVIPADKVADLIFEPDFKSKANPFSEEYIIKNLKGDMFDKIKL